MNLTELNDRLIQLHNGAQGLRSGMTTECKAVDGTDAPVMDFIGSSGAVDRYNEVIEQSGWDLTYFRRNPVIPDCHDYSSITRILGRALSVDVLDGRLVNRVEFATENPLGMLAWKMARGGFIKSQSVGFIPVEWVNGAGKDQPARTYKKCELLEISLVVVPANPEATLGLAMKSGALERADLRDLSDWLKQFCSEDPAAHGRNASAPASASNGARILQLARDLDNVLRAH